MIFAVTRKVVATLVLSCLLLFTKAQPGKDPAGRIKPYRILSSGKQITVKSTKDIQNIMVWTASGHRIVEQKGVNAPAFIFYTGMNEKVFFLMIEFKGNERYTEKIGIR